MIVPWMLYAVVAALLLGLAARALEGVVRQSGRPIRWLWLTALAGSLTLPLLAAFVAPRVTPPVSRGAVAAAPPAIPDLAPAEWLPAAPPVARPAGSVPDPYPALLAGWGLASLALAGCVGAAHGRLLRRRRGWSAREIEGREVWVSPDTGPAVVGLARSFIVVPEWVLERDREEVEMVLTHEAEHLRAGDPRLLLAAMLMLVACPWNPALWWQWRRLKQAVEVDCDLRVLSRGTDPRRYSRLLVAVAERGSSQRLVLASLAEPRSLLERRIEAMVAPPSRRWPGRAALAALIASVLVTAACRMDRPSTPEPGVAGEPLSAEAAGEIPVDDLPAGWQPPPMEPSERTDHDAVRLALQNTFPEVLTGEAEGSRHYVVLITNTRGEIEHSHLEANPAYPIGSVLEDLYEWFPGTNWHEARKTWRGTLETYPPPTMGPDTVFVTYAERRVEGEPTGPFLLYRAPRRAEDPRRRIVAPASMERPAPQQPATFRITTAAPGRQVAIRVSGAAVGEERGVEIEASSLTRAGDVLLARTPLTVTIRSEASVEVIGAGGPLDLTVDGRDDRISGERLVFTRQWVGASGTRRDAPTVPGNVPGVVLGSVMSVDGRPLAGAPVVVAGTSMGAVTDLNGQFAIIGIPPGTRQLRAKASGYGEGVRIVEVLAGDTVRASLRLATGRGDGTKVWMVDPPAPSSFDPLPGRVP